MGQRYEAVGSLDAIECSDEGMDDARLRLPLIESNKIRTAKFFTKVDAHRLLYLLVTYAMVAMTSASNTRVDMQTTLTRTKVSEEGLCLSGLADTARPSQKLVVKSSDDEGRRLPLNEMSAWTSWAAPKMSDVRTTGRWAKRSSVNGDL